MDSQLRRPGKTFPNENQAQLLLSAAEVMNRNNEEENSEVLNILESSKCRHCMHCNEGITAITKAIRNTMFEISEVKERNRERRHKEILETFKNYLSQSDEPKVLINTQISSPESYVSQLDDKTKVDIGPIVQLCNKIDVMKETKQCTQKRLVNTIESQNKDVPPKKSANSLNNIKIETLLESADAIIKASQKDELVAMRKKMLAKQRQKMEDRERKKVRFLN